MKVEELGKLLLDGLLVAQNGRLVVHDCVHVCLERVHVLANEDLVTPLPLPGRREGAGHETRTPLLDFLTLVGPFQ